MIRVLDALTVDQSVFPDFTGYNQLLMVSSIDSDKPKALPDQIEISTEIWNLAATKMLHQDLRVYDTSALTTDTLFLTRLELSPGTCLTAGSYLMRVHWDPNNVLGDDTPANNAAFTAALTVQVYGDRMLFGPIEVDITDVASYNRTTGEFSGTIAWGNIKDIPTGTIVISPVGAPDCEASVVSGTVPISLPQPYKPIAGDWEYFSSNVTLDSTGCEGDFQLPLPAGVWYKTTYGFPLFLEEPLDLGTARLDQNRVIVGSFGFFPGEMEVVKMANEPFWIRFTEARWEDASGFVLLDAEPIYIHQDEFDYSGDTRASNDGFLYNTSSIPTGKAYINPDGVEVALESTAPSTFRMGFPFGWELQDVTWYLAYGANRLQGGHENVAKLTVTHNTGSCDGGAATNTIVYSGQDFELGLDGAMLKNAVLTGSDQQFGFETFKIGPVTAPGMLFFPGWVAMGDKDVKQILSPAEYLLQGRLDLELDPATVVLPGEQKYAIGEGYYAGLTLERPDLTGVEFSMLLACADAPFVASEFNKFYLRRGGFSGTLDASKNSPALGNPLMLYGAYETTLKKFTYLFLDNEQALSSDINGSIYFPFPSDATLDFDRMSIEKCGGVGETPIRRTESTLAYWDADFGFSYMEFRDVDPPNTMNCGGVTIDEKTLWTRSSNSIPQLNRSVLVETNLLGNGDIADNKIIGEVANTLQGWNFALRKVYYSAWDGTSNYNGKTVLVGDMRLPFWGLRTLQAVIDLGGLPEVFDGRPYATSPPGDIDPNRDAFPDSKPSIDTIAEYLDDPDFRPFVDTSFAGIVDLGYPVKYNTIAREFGTVTGEELTKDLVVVDVDSSIRYISQARTEILFGVQYDGLPMLNIGSMLSDFTDPVVQSLLSEIQSGMDDINDALGANFTDALRPAMMDVTRPYVVQAVNEMKTIAADVDGYVSDPALDTTVDDLVADVRTNLQGQIRNATGPVQAQATMVLARLDELEEIVGRLNIEQIRSIMETLVAYTGVDASGIESVLDDVESARAYLVEDVINAQLRPRIEELNQILDDAGNLTFLDDIMADNAEYLDAINRVDQKLHDYLASVRGNAATIRNLDPEVVNALLVNEFMNTVLVQQLENEMQKVFEPLRQQIESIFNSFFSSLNGYVLQFLDSIEASINDAITDLNDVIGVKAAEMNGYATISGEVLERLHIDAKFEMSEPNDLSYRGALDMQRFVNDTGGAVCGVPAGGSSIRVEIAAYGIPISFGYGDLTADEIALLLRLIDEGSGPYLSDIGGHINTTGEMDFEALNIFDPKFGAGVGANENYVYFATGMEFEGYTIEGGIFLGRSCDGMKILEVIDPEVGNVLEVTEIFGIYAFGEGPIPIVDFGCVLRANATVGAGFWYFINGPMYGGKLTGGFTGRLACVVGLRGKLTLVGGKDATSYFFNGNAWVAGGVGWCSPSKWKTPRDVRKDDWCYTCIAYLDLIYRNDWSVDYSVDCE
ncbi:hypothetical protein KQI84_17500 [bacterium]|nr:hypothetical protein [bacterium]